MKRYNVICMSFDGEFKRERPMFDDIEKAWEYSSNLGSKWYFYPFHFVATEKTIIDSPEPLEWIRGKRIKTIQKIFNQHSQKDITQGMDVETFMLTI